MVAIETAVGIAGSAQTGLSRNSSGTIIIEQDMELQEHAMYVPHAKVDMRGMTLIYLINNTNHFLKKSAVAKMHAGMQHVQDHVHIAALFTQNMCVQALSMTRASL